ncbi:HTH-type transcriptional regulator immR [uncultured Eubacterium sp.]|nr:HTH-type transcriptional regulator immR [uncultured Eubacterium sp.]
MIDKNQKRKINKQIGARVKAAREASAYTQERFAEEIGLSIQHVSNLERGITGPSISTIIKMSKVLGVSCDYLLLGRSGKRDVARVESQLDNLTTDQLVIVDKGIRIILEAFKVPVNALGDGAEQQ